MKISIVKSAIVVVSTLAFVGCDSTSTVVEEAATQIETIVEEEVDALHLKIDALPVTLNNRYLQNSSIDVTS